MSKIMIVAGGMWQIPLVKKAKEMGHYVICSNLYEDSPAFPYADACEVANVLDKEANLKIAQKYMPDAVISDQSDIAVPTVAYVNEKLGLRGIGTERAKIFTNKYAMREHCKKHGFHIPDYKLCETLEEAETFLQKYKKIIIKPLDSQSSRGVFTICSKEELKEHFDEAMEYSNTVQAILTEEYIGGDEFTIDGVCVEGIHYPLCVSIKQQYEHNPNISRALYFSHYSEKYDYDKLRETNKKMVESIGLPFGLTHAEYKFDKGNFYLIEMAARGGGSNLSSKIVPAMSGVDNYEFLIRSALGQPLDTAVLEQASKDRNRAVAMRFFDFGAGKVKSIEGVDYPKYNPDIIEFLLEVKEGDELVHPKYGRLRPGFFIVTGNGIDAVKKRVQEVEENVKVIFE